MKHRIPCPSKQMVLEASKMYFQHCHNQPSTFFDEHKFFQSLENDEFPNCLQLAIIATSIRHSTNTSSCWINKKNLTIEIYADSAWAMITNLELSLQDKPNLLVVQAIALLCIIDVAGKN